MKKDKIGAEEHLVFGLGSEEYAVKILCVQEIRSFQQPTTIAGAPAYVLGVINLRGSIVPIMDLRIKIGSPAEITQQTVTIVLSVNDKSCGIVVDSVSDVVSVNLTKVEDTPVKIPDAVNFISGIIKADNRLLMLVDTDKLTKELVS